MPPLCFRVCSVQPSLIRPNLRKRATQRRHKRAIVDRGIHTRTRTTHKMHNSPVWLRVHTVCGCVWVNTCVYSVWCVSCHLCTVSWCTCGVGLVGAGWLSTVNPILGLWVQNLYILISHPPVLITAVVDRTNESFAFY